MWGIIINTRQEFSETFTQEERRVGQCIEFQYEPAPAPAPALQLPGFSEQVPQSPLPQSPLPQSPLPIFSVKLYKYHDGVFRISFNSKESDCRRRDIFQAWTQAGLPYPRMGDEAHRYKKVISLTTPDIQLIGFSLRALMSVQNNLVELVTLVSGILKTNFNLSYTPPHWVSDKEVSLLKPNQSASYHNGNARSCIASFTTELTEKGVYNVYFSCTDVDHYQMLKKCLANNAFKAPTKTDEVFKTVPFSSAKKKEVMKFINAIDLALKTSEPPDNSLSYLISGFERIFGKLEEAGEQKGEQETEEVSRKESPKKTLKQRLLPGKLSRTSSDD